MNVDTLALSVTSAALLMLAVRLLAPRLPWWRTMLAFICLVVGMGLFVMLAFVTITR